MRSASGVVLALVVAACATKHNRYAVAVADADAKLKAAEPRDTSSQAEAAIEKGNAIEAWSRVDLEQQGKYPEAIASYRMAAERGTPEQRALARNNACILLLRLGDAQRAVEECDGIDASSAPRAQRAAYHYNKGRALEQAGRAESALAEYEAALRDDPSFARAADAAFLLLSSGEVGDPSAEVSPPGRAPSAVAAAHAEPSSAKTAAGGEVSAGLLLPHPVTMKTASLEFAQTRYADSTRRMWDLALRLVDSGQASLAADELRSVLRERKSPAATPDLLVPLARAWVALPVSIEQLRDREMPFLLELGSAGGAWQSPASALRDAFQAPLPRLRDPMSARARFSWWAVGARASAMSALLRHVGDLRADSGDLEQAVSRYEHAFGLDPENVDAAVHLAALLREHRQELDRDGTSQWLVTQLFGMKGEAYARGDSKGVVRLHSVLGTLYEEEKRWGSEYQPDSALFQWTRAARTAQQIRASDPSYGPTPGISVHLATAQLAVGQRSEAVKNLLDGAEGFLAMDDEEAARGVLDQLAHLPIPQQQERRLAALRARANPVTAPPGPPEPRPSPEASPKRP